MPNNVDSQPLTRLLESKLDTFEKVELVLLLHNAAAPISLVEAARELQIGTDVLRRVAIDVERKKVLSITDDQLQLTATPAELEAINRASELYTHDRQALIECLSQIAMNRLRSMAAQRFADAFRIRKKEDDNG